VGSGNKYPLPVKTLGTIKLNEVDKRRRDKSTLFPPQIDKVEMSSLCVCVCRCERVYQNLYCYSVGEESYI